MKKTVDDILEDDNKEKFKKALYKGEYIEWLSKYLEEHEDIDDTYYLHENSVSEEDEYMIEHLEDFLKELNKCMVINNKYIDDISRYQFSYRGNTYEVGYNGECYYCKKTTSNKNDLDYKTINKMYEKNMKCNFALLKDRVIDTMDKTDLEMTRRILTDIKDPTIVVGVGGSNVVSEFTSKVLNRKNNIIATNSEPRDMLYRTNAYKNVIACSYSANDYVIKLAFQSGLRKYLLSSICLRYDDVTSVVYDITLPEEKSFISLATTLMPISLLLDYYLDGNAKEYFDLIKEDKKYTNFDNVFEIFTGFDTSTASKFLETTIAESGIGIPIVHDKYAYCHGRSTLGYHNETTAIYLNKNTELDKLMLDELRKYHKNIIVIDSKYKDPILDDYQMLIKAMYLTEQIAESKGKDLSKVDHSPLVKKLYKYNGNI